MTATETHLDDLTREVRSLHARINNGLAVRAARPTYGYTKAGLLADLHRLEGMLYAHRLVTGEAPHNPMAPLGAYPLITFGFSLPTLTDTIRKA